MTTPHPTPSRAGRAVDRVRETLADDHGAGFSTPALIMLLALTAIACLSLLIDGGRATNAQRNANSIAFQAARSAAQQLDQTQLRTGSIAVNDTATQAAHDTASLLLAEVDLTGQVTSVTIDDRTITVTLTATAALTTSAVLGRSDVTVTGVGTTRIATGITNEEPPLP